MKERREKSIAFIGITYLLTILFHFILQIQGGHSNPVSLDLLGIPMLFPFIAVIILQKSFLKEGLKSDIKLSLQHNRWLLYALLIPILMSLLLNMMGIILFENQVVGINEALKILGINIAVGISIASISAFLKKWDGEAFYIRN